MKSLALVFFLWTVLVEESIQADTEVVKTPFVSFDAILGHLMSLERRITKCEVKSKMEELQSDIQELKEKMKSLENRTNVQGKRRAVAFQVQLIKDPLPAGNRDVLKFDDVTLNTGNAYNPNSGIFTAPVAGTYFFWANIMSKDNGWYAITLQKEDNMLTKGYTGLGLKHGTATITHTVKLRKGERIWFANERHGTTGTVIEGFKFSNYGGTLLFV